LTVEEGSGDLIVAEDGGNMELVVVTPEREVGPLLRIVGHDLSEVTGPAFSPDGTRLYFSSQRGAGTTGLGVTWEVTGPFRGAAARAAATTTTSAPTVPSTLAELAAGAPDDDSGSSTAVPALVGGGAVVAGAAGLLALRARRARLAGEATTERETDG